MHTAHRATRLLHVVEKHAKGVADDEVGDTTQSDNQPLRAAHPAARHHSLDGRFATITKRGQDDAPKYAPRTHADTGTGLLGPGTPRGPRTAEGCGKIAEFLSLAPREEQREQLDTTQAGLEKFLNTHNIVCHHLIAMLENLPKEAIPLVENKILLQMHQNLQISIQKSWPQEWLRPETCTTGFDALISEIAQFESQRLVFLYKIKFTLLELYDSLSSTWEMKWVYFSGGSDVPPSSGTVKSGLSGETEDPRDGSGPPRENKTLPTDNSSDSPYKTQQTDNTGGDGAMTLSVSAQQILVQDPRGETHVLLYCPQVSTTANLERYSLQLHLPPPAEFYILWGSSIIQPDLTREENGLPRENEPRHVPPGKCSNWACVEEEPVWGTGVIHDRLRKSLDIFFSKHTKITHPRGDAALRQCVLPRLDTPNHALEGVQLMSCDYIIGTVGH